MVPAGGGHENSTTAHVDVSTGLQIGGAFPPLCSAYPHIVAT
jgi:hypothetical protein